MWEIGGVNSGCVDACRTNTCNPCALIRAPSFSSPLYYLHFDHNFWHSVVSYTKPVSVSMAPPRVLIAGYRCGRKV